MQPFILILSTASSKKEARRIASRLLKKKAAACINIIPSAESHYYWKGKKETAKEVLLFIKSRASLFSRVEKIIRENHSYSVPEIIAVPIQKGNRSYLAWVKKETR